MSSNINVKVLPLVTILSHIQKKGLRFRALQQSIAANFPGLKIEFHPAVLKRALERGSYSGDLECVSCCLLAVSISALCMQ